MVEGVILEPREIARRYVTSWFALDLVSSLPVDYIIVLVSPETGVTQLVHAGQYDDDSEFSMRPPQGVNTLNFRSLQHPLASSPDSSPDNR